MNTRLQPVLLAAVMAAAPLAWGAGDEAKAVTFTKDVAPIFFENCATCHRPGDIAPMSLLSYEEARPWAKSIQKKVVDREMPPWHSVDPHGTFANDRRLTQAQIDTIDAWIRQGAKEGNPKDLPSAPEFTTEWRLGEPDYVMTFDAKEVPADGPDLFQNLMGMPDWTEDKWVTAIEVRPGNRKVVHHVIVITMEDLEATQGSAGIQGWLAGWAAGAQPVVMPEGTARLVKAGQPIIANMHWHPYGEATTEQTSVGFHFAEKTDNLRLIKNKWILNAGFEIPAGEASHEVRAEYTVEEESLLMNIAPHMHFRGKDMTIKAHFPDGSQKTLVEVPNYDFNWQTVYEYVEPVPLPPGTKIDIVGHFDNSAANPFNPDPTKNITWGPESFDEMFIGIMDIVKLSDDSTATGD